MNKLQKYIYSYSTDDFSVLYHSLTMDLMYLDSPEKFKNESLVRDFVVRNKPLENRIINSEGQIPPSWETLYLFLNDICNMRCKYCRYMNQMSFEKKLNEMREEDALALIDTFIEQSNPTRNKTFVFFGTEVFISFNLMLRLLEYIRAKSPSSEIVIFTNGTLVTKERATQLAQWDVKCIVSLDGPREIHDSERVFSNGKGSFEKIYTGYQLLKNQNLPVGISLTVGGHNVDILDEIIEFFHRELDPINIGFNPLEVTDKYPREIYFLKYIESSLKAYAKARDFGISIPQLMHRIRPFVNKTIRLRDCPACGGALRAFQNGIFGPCAHFVIDGDHGYNVSKIKDFQFESNFHVNMWNDRTTLSMDCANDCFAAGICGGGCVRNAYLLHGDINAPDDRICLHSKFTILWLIDDLFSFIKDVKFWNENGYYIPTSQDRKKILGGIHETEELPLQNYSLYGELKL